MSDKENIMLTFPYPYMNGELHMGHWFTSAKCDYLAKFYLNCGHEVLFPFAFHCTGTPIYAAAHKLKNGDEVVRKNLLDSGVTEEDLELFHDPEHWLEYFPMKAFELLKTMNMSIDFERGFITTSSNPYYDSFVQWQFNKLRAQGRISKGKRNSIFSREMKMICGDHERSTGEGVNAVEYELYLTDENEIKAKEYPDEYLNSGKVVPFDDFTINSLLLSNIQHQEKIAYEEGKVSTVFLPESVVVSRAGDVCIVALTEQWYINYGEDTWKERVRAFITDKLETHNDDVKDQLLIAVDWLKERGFSREVGLGTKIPWDPKYVIESLSDSTIYMAYYTVAHLLHHDLYGKEPNMIRVDQLCDEFWDQVFSIEEDAEDEIMHSLQLEFRKWYPVSVRISGKDLISNHLLMCIYNHIAIFGEKMTPRSFLCNGYITIEKQKMSKSMGNFITIEKALTEHGEDAMRLTLASAGDSMDDANFNMKTLKSMKQKLAKFKIVEDQIPTSRKEEIELNITIDQLFAAYETRKFQQVIKLAFHTKVKANGAFYRMFLHPIIPNTVERASEEDYEYIMSRHNFVTEEDMVYLENLNQMEDLIKKVNKCLQKSRKKKMKINKITTTITNETLMEHEMIEFARTRTKFNELYFELVDDGERQFKLDVELD